MLKNLFLGVLFLMLSANTIEAQKVNSKTDSLSASVKTINIKKMKVEIWSDVMCPFCYIGKRKFEAALAEFPERDNIEVEWKSFQLNPAMKTEPDKSINQYLAEVKGWSLDYAKKMNDYVTGMAKESGLTYNLDKAVVANSFDAHRLSHLAKKYGKQDALEEALFKAYFTDGKNTADSAVLLALGESIGLGATEVKEVLSSNLYADAVQQDIYEARQVGVNGVPFFVMGNKQALSGAQDSRVFLKNLEKAYAEWLKDSLKKGFVIKEGKVCTPDGECK